jgi:hypothetical protein
MVAALLADICERLLRLNAPSDGYQFAQDIFGLLIRSKKTVRR